MYFAFGIHGVELKHYADLILGNFFEVKISQKDK